MTMDITKSVAFTGHRSERILQVRMLYLYLDIVSQVKRLYSLGSRYFLSGMATDTARRTSPYTTG